jgi:UDP-2,3-diacylglucosamine hydrolase
MLKSSDKDWIFVSDAHFTGRDSKEMESFLRFLDAEKERLGYLVILGDLFEFFFGFKNFSSGGGTIAFGDYLPILEGLQYLYRRGIRIMYFEGNHDFFLHSFFPENFGMEVEVYPDGKEERLGERKTFIAHGDLSNLKQWRYLIHFAGPQISRRVAQRLNEISYRKYHIDLQPTPPPAFKAFAHRKFLEGFEIVILGHSHFPEEVEEWINGKRCSYFNVGDWMNHRSFLRFTPPEHFELERYE